MRRNRQFLQPCALVAFLVNVGGFSACSYDYSDAGRGTSASTSGTGGSAATTASSGSDSSAATGGGGGAEPLDPFFRAGSRLSPEYVDYGGGVRQFIDWYDTTLGSRCTFTHFESGAILCAPPAGDASQFYEDAACSKPLMNAGDAGCGVPAYATTTNPSTVSCDIPNTNTDVPTAAGPASIRAALGPFTGATVYAKVSSVCTAQTPPMGAKLWHTGSPPLAPSALVSATLTKEPRAGSLQEEIYAGSDGSYQIHRPFDGAVPCKTFYPQVLTSTPAICMRENYGFSSANLFTDPACTMAEVANQPFTRNLSCAGDTFFYEYTLDANNCSTGTHFFGLGSVETGPYYVLSGAPATCQTYITTGTTPVARGAEFDPFATFETITPQVRGASNAFSQHFLGMAPDKPVDTSLTFVNEATGAACRPTLFDGDPKPRCVPTADSQSYGFADAACTIPALTVYTATSCGAPPQPTPTHLYLPSTMPGCAAHNLTTASTVWSLKPDKELFYVKNGASCAAQDYGPDYVYLEADKQVSPAVYPELELQVH